MNQQAASRTVPPSAEHPAMMLETVRVDSIPVALPLMKPVVMAGVRIENGRTRRLEGCGLGVEVNEANVNRFRA